MAKSGGLSKAKTKKLVADLEKELNLFHKHYTNLQKSVETIEKGKNSDGEVGLWSGKKARTWVISAKTHCARDAELFNDLEDCVQTLDYAITAARSE